MEELFPASDARLARPLPTMVPRCDQCGLSEKCLTPKMRVDGRGAKRILIVGDRPGHEEDKNGRPFVGPSGVLLADALRRAGVDMRRDCWVTNATICYTPGELPKTAVDDCRPNVLRAIRELDPVVVLLLGGLAVRSVLGHYWGKSDPGPVGRWTGYRVPCHRPNAWLCPASNPAYLLRTDDPVAALEFRRDVEAAVGCCGERPWPAGPPDFASRCAVVADPDEAADILDRVGAGPVAFDFETDRLKPDHPDARLVCASVAYGDAAFAFPWCQVTADAFKRIVTCPAIKKVGWNIQMEDRWCRRFLGVPVAGWHWDGMTTAHALDPRRGVTGLKFQAFARLGVGDYNRAVEPFLASEKAGGNEPNRVRDVRPHTLMKYCAADSVLELELFRRQAELVGVAGD